MESFRFDVFLSHSSKDKSVIRPLAERLRKDGVRVWLDEWEIKPGDSIPAKIEEGLEHSRVLVLCMSANAFGSDWAQLESGTFRFRDPLNKERRFLPLRLDDAHIKSSLAHFLYINWLPAEREQGYVKLLQACRPVGKPTAAEENALAKQVAVRVTNLRSKAGINIYAFSEDRSSILVGASDNTVQLWDLDTARLGRVFKGHVSEVYSGLVWTKDNRLAISGARDSMVRVWEVETGRCVRVLKGHTDQTWQVALSPDERRVLSSSDDGTLRLWDLESGKCVRVFEGHSSRVFSVAWIPKQERALSGSDDKTVRLWDTETGRCLSILQGHAAGVWCLESSSDGRRALSGSMDKTVRLWDIELGRCLRILEGHKSTPSNTAWNGDHRFALSGALDGTVRLWDTETGRCLRVLKGHRAGVQTVAWSTDCRRAFSGDRRGEIRVWDLSKYVTKVRAPKVTVPFALPAPEQVQYTNAKVLLVGESGAGKTGLSNYLAHGLRVQDEKPLPSTDGAWATHWPLKHDKKKAGVEREIWLWDFAGQVDYRLVHQLHMEDAAAAVVVFDPQKEDLFDGLGRWDRDIQKATRRSLAKLLAAGRVDRGGLVVSAANVKKFMKERSFVGPLHETSAKTGKGCDELREAIVRAIDWKGIPETTSPVLYHRLKQEILSLRDSGLVLIRLAELKQRMEVTLHGTSFELAELEAVIGLLAGPGMVQRLDFGGFILLRPEVLSRYAAAVVRKVRKHPQELGCIREDELLIGDLDYQDFKRMENREDEKVVLRALLELFLNRAWCLRQPCDGTALLTFPSYFRRERPEQPSHPSVLVTYRFNGPAEDVYATLVVRLHHTVAFQSTDLWKAAADFKTQTGAKLGFTLQKEGEGTSRLEVYFEPDVDENSRVLFLRYVHEHLGQHAQDVVRLRHYACGNKKCDAHGEQFTDQSKIDKALAAGGKGRVFCPDCGKPINLRDTIENKFESSEVKELVRVMEGEAQVEIDSESKELVLVGHAFAIVGEAGQIYRGYTNSDHGIDGELEFKDDQGRASGKRLYMQLKSGDSYLKKRARDGAEVFQIKNPRWADYWQRQSYAVMLVIRTSDGEIRWMDVSAYLKRESSGEKAIKQIVFEGERFDVMSVRRWREQVLKI